MLCAIYNFFGNLFLKKFKNIVKMTSKWLIEITSSKCDLKHGLKHKNKIRNVSSPFGFLSWTSQM